MELITDLTMRVYGILLSTDKQKILVSDERIKGTMFTKFPGGGLELGEGLKDCLRREFKEELGIDVLVGEHIYTTDYFQKSLFRPSQQFIGIYYFFSMDDDTKVPMQTVEDNSAPGANITGFRWIAINDLTEEAVTLPTDKIVVNKILKMKV